MYSVTHIELRDFFKAKGLDGRVGFLRKGEFIPFPANVDLTTLEARGAGPILRAEEKTSGHTVSINLPIYPNGKGLPTQKANYINKMYQKCLNELSKHNV